MRWVTIGTWSHSRQLARFTTDGRCVPSGRPFCSSSSPGRHCFTPRPHMKIAQRPLLILAAPRRRHERYHVTRYLAKEDKPGRCQSKPTDNNGEMELNVVSGVSNQSMAVTVFVSLLTHFNSLKLRSKGLDFLNELRCNFNVVRSAQCLCYHGLSLFRNKPP
jgi:hypothetical protein